MTQRERREYLIQALLQENGQYKGFAIPDDDAGQKRLLRALFNVRLPQPVSETFLKIQDAYLQEEIRRKGITDISTLQPMEQGIFRSIPDGKGLSALDLQKT